MSYVAAAYLLAAALVAGYVLSLVARQRVIAALAEAAVHSAPPRPRHPSGARPR